MIFLLNNYQYISADVEVTSSSASPISDTTIDFQQKRIDLIKARDQLNIEQAVLAREKNLMEKFLNNSEVIQFNVGGEIMFTTTATLLRVADSKISKILLGKTKEKLSIDRDGNKFLDYNPELFRHVLEQLRLFEDGEDIIFYPPLTPTLTLQFNSMLDQLGLKPAPISDDDIFTFNVGDEIIATKRKTLNSVPNSKLSSLLTMNKPNDMDLTGRPFLDYDPKLFRHLLSQLQIGRTKDFLAPSDETKLAFNSMLKKFDLIPK